MSLLRSSKLVKLLNQTSVFATKHNFTTRCGSKIFSQLLVTSHIQRRGVSVTPSQNLKEKKISITFINRKGDHIPIEAEVNKTLLDVAKDCELDLEGFGICDGTVSCSTCHVIFENNDFKKVGSAKSDDEKDMLDMALGRTDNSRLGCQVVLTKDMDGIIVILPTVVTDAREL